LKVWLHKKEYVIFSDVKANTVYKWKEGEGVNIYLPHSGLDSEEGESASCHLFLLFYYSLTLSRNKLSLLLPIYFALGFHCILYLPQINLLLNLLPHFITTASKEGVTKEPGANGIIEDKKSESLIICEHGRRRVSICN
jgi:hypothetical protein